MRQQGQTEMEYKFQEALGHLHLGTVTKADWEFFQSRVLANPSLEDQERFQQSTFLFTTNADVVERNITMLEKVTHPNGAVARIEAKYHGISMEEGAKIDSDYCNGLEHVLHVCIDARVSFTLRIKSNRRSCWQRMYGSPRVYTMDRWEQ